MYLYRPGIDVPVWLEILVKIVAGQLTVNQLDTANLDYPMALLGLETGCFRIKYDLAHGQALFLMKLSDATALMPLDIVRLCRSGFAQQECE